MKLFGVVLVAVTLAGCSLQTSHHKIEVTGSADEVSRFVAAEAALDPDTEVDHRRGQGRAAFSMSSEKALDELADRAGIAKLAVETRSSSWSVEANP